RRRSRCRPPLAERPGRTFTPCAPRPRSRRAPPGSGGAPRRRRGRGPPWADAPKSWPLRGRAATPAHHRRLPQYAVTSATSPTPRWGRGNRGRRFTSRGYRRAARLEERLRDERRNDRAGDDDSHEHGVLRLIDEVVLQAKERRDGSEGQAGRHEQGGVV